MTLLEERVLAAVRVGPRPVHELVLELRCAARTVESALRLLERDGLVRREEDRTHVVVWRAAGAAAGACP